MKTVPFSDILSSVCQIVGLDRITLNDKGFFAIRDLANRRIGQVWDREEWPDIERYIEAYPGNPVTSVDFESPVFVTDAGETIVTDSEEFLVASTGQNETTIQLDTDFPRIYLANFEEDAYKLGTVGSTKLKILNGFYLTLEDGSSYNSEENEYEFTYSTATDDFGDYITSIKIEVPIGSSSPITYGLNGPLTPVLSFLKNKNCVVKLPTNVVHGLDAWDRDPRGTSRVIPSEFLLEEISMEFSGEDSTFLRFVDNNKKCIKYRLAAPRLTGMQVQALSPYSKDACVYFDIKQGHSEYYPSVFFRDSGGDFWVAKTVVPVGTFPQNGSVYWKKLEIPMRFKDYVINGTSADFMRSEGRAEEANIFEGLAEQSIQQQIDVYIRQQGQNMRMNMVYTY
jgi:hypothetical protein